MDVNQRNGREREGERERVEEKRERERGRETEDGQIEGEKYKGGP
jgi:hypothetical protein